MEREVREPSSSATVPYAVSFARTMRSAIKVRGYKVSPQELSRIMLALQRRGCHNINLVSPSHFVPQIVEALSPGYKGRTNLALGL